MDDEATRRDRPTTHVAFGEPTALLAAFGLVALAARSVVEIRCSPTELSSLIDFQIQLLRVLDSSSLIEGQDLDLRLRGDERERQRALMIQLKTVPLFELSARAGLLFSDPDSRLARDLRRFACEYGMAFQVADDFLDGETTDPAIVLAQLDRTRECLTPFAPAAADLEQLIDYLHARCFAKKSS